MINSGRVIIQPVQESLPSSQPNQSSIQLSVPSNNITNPSQTDLDTSDNYNNLRGPLTTASDPVLRNITNSALLNSDANPVQHSISSSQLSQTTTTTPVITKTISSTTIRPALLAPINSETAFSTTTTQIQSNSAAVSPSDTEFNQISANPGSSTPLEEFSFTYSQDDERENTRRESIEGPNARTQKRYQNSKHVSIRNLLESYQNDNGNRDMDMVELTDELRSFGEANKLKKEQIAIYKETEASRKRVRRDIKNGLRTEEQLEDSEKNLLAKRAKNERFFAVLNNKIYINVRSKYIMAFFKKTVDDITRIEKELPISKCSRDNLYKQIFMYLYHQGITTYKEASAQVSSLFIALVSNFDDLYEDEYGGGFRYKEEFLKQMQNIRATLRQAGVNFQPGEFEDVPPSLDEQLPCS